MLDNMVPDGGASAKGGLNQHERIRLGHRIRQAASRDRRRARGLIPFNVGGLPRSTLAAIQQRKRTAGHTSQGETVQEYVATARRLIGESYGVLPLLSLVAQAAQPDSKPRKPVSRVFFLPQSAIARLDGLNEAGGFGSRGAALAAIVPVCDGLAARLAAPKEAA